MGAWGAKLFEDDAACDIRDEYREHIEDGVDDSEATRLTLEKFASWFEDPKDGAKCVLALAVTQSKIGRLDPALRDRAIAALDTGVDLADWERDNPKLVPKRRAALEQARVQLLGPQPRRKRLKPPARPGCGLAAGDALALAVPSGFALLRVVRIDAHRVGETPILEEMQFKGVQLPVQDELERMVPKAGGGIALFKETRFTAFVACGKIDWEHAGFQKAGRFPPQPGDDQAPRPSSGMAWSAIAQRLKDE